MHFHMLEEVMILGRLRIDKRTVWYTSVLLARQDNVHQKVLQHWLKHSHYMATWGWTRRSLNVPFNPNRSVITRLCQSSPAHSSQGHGYPHSRAKQPPWSGSASPEMRHRAAVQHGAAAPTGSVLAGSAPRGHSKWRTEYHPQDLKHQ